MNRQPYRTPPRWWSPRPSPFWTRLLRPIRRKRQRRRHGLFDVEVRGREHLLSALNGDQGVLITPNHPSHGDPFALIEASEQLGTPFYFMAAWQVFAMTHRLGRRVLRQHGCFSVNREGYDVRAIRCAVRVLEDRKRPLVIFPEGEVFHLNDRVIPFRRGAAAAAMLAARHSRQPVACVPCALKFQFLGDPLSNLLALTARLELAMRWAPRTCAPLPVRVQQLIEAVISLQEVAHLGGSQKGSVRDRVERLMDVLVGRLEDTYRVDWSGTNIPERVKQLRFRIIRRREVPGAAAAVRAQCDEHLEQLFVVMQLFSYPIDYLAGAPSLDRIAETLDKLEEDVLEVQTAGVRGPRRAVISFGEPVLVTPDQKPRADAEDVSRILQSRVQTLLDRLNAGAIPLREEARELAVPAGILEPAIALA